MRPLAVLLLIATMSALGEGRAAADEEPSVRTVIEGTVDRARRAVAFGPTVGGAIVYAPTPGDADFPLSFGVALVLFKVPVVPGPALIQEVVVSRLKARIGARTDLDEAELAEIAREVKAEVLGEMSVRPKTFEKPRLAIALEGAFLPRGDAWQARLTVGVGLSMVTIGPTIAGSFGDANGLHLGGELAVHLMHKKSARAPVFDLFLRGDLGVTDATTDASTIGVGARVMLDLI
jgi:hypothetical protein